MTTTDLERERPREGRSTNPAIALGRAAVRAYGTASAGQRPDPDFLIIGAKRGGSTSFYYDLLRHSHMCALYPRPGLLPKAEATKGVHYFDINHFRGERWYRGHLPSRGVRARQSRRVGGTVITGEASPYYMFHPAAAARAADMVPAAKIVAVLRDPVERTFSHWKERRRGGHEPLEFVDALRAEDERIGDAERRLAADDTYYSYAHEQLSYARQSAYVVGLRRWYAAFPADQILVLSSEDYYAEPDRSLEQVQRFLGLPVESIASGEVRNAAAAIDLEPGIKQELSDRFAVRNHELEQLTGRSFNWT